MSEAPQENPPNVTMRMLVVHPNVGAEEGDKNPVIPIVKGMESHVLISSNEPFILLYEIIPVGGKSLVMIEDIKDSSNEIDQCVFQKIIQSSREKQMREELLPGYQFPYKLTTSHGALQNGSQFHEAFLKDLTRSSRRYSLPITNFQNKNIN